MRSFCSLTCITHVSKLNFARSSFSLNASCFLCFFSFLIHHSFFFLLYFTKYTTLTFKYSQYKHNRLREFFHIVRDLRPRRGSIFHLAMRMKTHQATTVRQALQAHRIVNVSIYKFGWVEQHEGETFEEFVPRVKAAEFVYKKEAMRKRDQRSS